MVFNNDLHYWIFPTYFVCLSIFSYFSLFLPYSLHVLSKKTVGMSGKGQAFGFYRFLIAVMGQVLPEVRLRRQNLDQSHVLFPLAVGTALFPRAISDHLTLATLILSSLAGWHATGFSGYWYVGSDHNSRCNGVTLLTSSFALWVLCITTFVAYGRSNDPAFCDEKSGRCNLASLPFLCSFRNFGHGGARASVIAWPVRIQS